MLCHHVQTANKTADFRLKAVTFDNVPWVVTMKKNDHYVSKAGSMEGILS